MTEEILYLFIKYSLSLGCIMLFFTFVFYTIFEVVLRCYIKAKVQHKKLVFGILDKEEEE